MGVIKTDVAKHIYPHTPQQRCMYGFSSEPKHAAWRLSLPVSHTVGNAAWLCGLFWATYFGTFVGQQKFWHRNFEETWQQAFHLLDCHGVCRGKKKHQFSQVTATCKTSSRAKTTLVMRCHCPSVLRPPKQRPGDGSPPNVGHQSRVSHHLGACSGGCGKTELMSDLSALWWLFTSCLWCLIFPPYSE